MELVDALILNAMQYGLEISSHPYDGVARQLGMDLAELFRVVRRLKRAGFIRRIGFSVNRSALGRVGALVAARVPRERLRGAAETIGRHERVKHSYARAHGRYNLWFTIEARNRDELTAMADRLVTLVGADEHVTLPSAKVCKLSVKYDLERGVSLSRPKLLPEDVPTIGDLGLEKEVVVSMADLPLVKRPFAELALRLGEREESLIDLVEELLLRGVYHDFGAVLDGSRAGFSANAMITAHGDEAKCEELALEAPEATHVILRDISDEKWDKPLFFVVHGKDTNIVDAVIEDIAILTGLKEYEPIYSLWGVTK